MSRCICMIFYIRLINMYEHSYLKKKRKKELVLFLKTSLKQLRKIIPVWNSSIPISFMF